MLSTRTSEICMLYLGKKTKVILCETSSLELNWAGSWTGTFGIKESGKEPSWPSNPGVLSTQGLMSSCLASLWTPPMT